MSSLGISRGTKHFILVISSIKDGASRKATTLTNKSRHRSSERLGRYYIRHVLYFHFIPLDQSISAKTRDQAIVQLPVR